MNTITIVNNKGGVGKTTSAVNLAAGLAGHHRVLLVDLDAQKSASLSLGLPEENLSPGATEVVLEGYPLTDAIHPSSVRNLDILPVSIGLASADLTLADVRGREIALSNILEPARKVYDFIILDCPPSLGLLTVNALTAADYFITPVTPDYLATEGLVNFMDAVKQLRKGMGSIAEPLGILLTLADYRLNVTGEIIRMIREYFGLLVFRTEIRTNVRLKEAPSFGKPIIHYDIRSQGAESYLSLAKEILAQNQNV